MHLFPIDAIEEGIKTQVSGVVMDTVKNKAIPNVTVAIVAHAPDLLVGSISKVFANTQTDKDGRFKLSFITDGYYVTYCITLGEDTTHRIVNYDNIELVVGAKYYNNIRLYARELNWLKAKITMDIPSPYNAMGIMNFPFYTYQHRSYYVKRVNRVDTSLLFKVLPMSKVILMYDVYAHHVTFDTIHSQIRYKDIVDIAMDDTTHYVQAMDSAFIINNYKPLW